MMKKSMAFDHKQGNEDWVAKFSLLMTMHRLKKGGKLERVKMRKGVLIIRAIITHFISS